MPSVCSTVYSGDVNGVLNFSNTKVIINFMINVDGLTGISLQRYLSIKLYLISGSITLMDAKEK